MSSSRPRNARALRASATSRRRVALSKFRLVSNSNCVSAGLTSVFKHTIDVFTFARLRYTNDERVVQPQLCVVDRMNRRSRKRNRNAGGDFEQVTAEECRVVGTATSDENDEVNVARLQQFSELCDLRALFRNRALECGWLLGDLWSIRDIRQSTL